MASRRKSVGSVDIDMTPMIDVTFQLITFFVFTLNFSEAVSDDRIQLPMSQLAKPAEGPATNPITLQLMTNGKVIYAGEPVALQDIGEYLENEKRVMISANKEPSSATVIVRADGRAATRFSASSRTASAGRSMSRATQRSTGSRRKSLSRLKLHSSTAARSVRVTFSTCWGDTLTRAPFPRLQASAAT